MFMAAGAESNHRHADFQAASSACLRRVWFTKVRIFKSSAEARGGWWKLGEAGNRCCGGAESGPDDT